MFQYASNQKFKLLQYIPFMCQKSKWYKEVKCPGTEGSVERIFSSRINKTVN